MDSESKTRIPKYVCNCIKDLHPKVRSLIYWKRPVESAIAMVAGFTILLSLGCLSLISVLSYLCLAILCCTGAARVYYDFVKSKKDDSDGTPFGDWISKDLNISRENVSTYVNQVIDRSEASIIYLKHVLLIESYFDSLKFAICMYLLSILGGFFNLLTIIIIGFALICCVPKIYDLYHPQIDKAVNTGKMHFDKVWSKVQVCLDKVPILRKQKDN